MAIIASGLMVADLMQTGGDAGKWLGTKFLCQDFDAGGAERHVESLPVNVQDELWQQMQEEYEGLVLQQEDAYRESMRKGQRPWRAPRRHKGSPSPPPPPERRDPSLPTNEQRAPTSPLDNIDWPSFDTIDLPPWLQSPSRLRKADPGSSSRAATSLPAATALPPPSAFGTVRDRLDADKAEELAIREPAEKAMAKQAAAEKMAAAEKAAAERAAADKAAAATKAAAEKAATEKAAAEKAAFEKAVAEKAAFEKAAVGRALIRAESMKVATEMAESAASDAIAAERAAEKAGGPEVMEAAKAKIRGLFESIDTDVSGSISRKELAAKLRADGELEALLGVADATSIPQVVRVMRLLDHTKELDADGDQYITYDEFEGAALADREAAAKAAADKAAAARAVADEAAAALAATKKSVAEEEAAEPSPAPAVEPPPPAPAEEPPAAALAPALAPASEPAPPAAPAAELSVPAPAPASASEPAGPSGSTAASPAELCVAIARAAEKALPPTAAEPVSKWLFETANKWRRLQELVAQELDPVVARVRERTQAFLTENPAAAQGLERLEVLYIDATTLCQQKLAPAIAFARSNLEQMGAKCTQCIDQAASTAQAASAAAVSGTGTGDDVIGRDEEARPS